jgi:signal transduction histidine kinase/CheY-like chemotaxis protein/ligand-binding sensor domain-containing protein/AraC-like DNA-binding protein
MFIRLFFSSFFILLLLISAVSQAQDYDFRSKKLDAENGLTNFILNDVFVDQDGFAWLATEYGLHRYDAQEFKVFTKERQGLYANRIHRIAQDANGKLWLMYLSALRSNKGAIHIDIFDPIRQETCPLFSYLKDSLPVRSYSEITSISSNKDKSIWIGTNKGAIYEYDGSSVRLLFQSKKKESPIRSILKTPKGNAWAKIKNEFCYIEFEQGKTKISSRFNLKQKKVQNHLRIHSVGTSEAIALLQIRKFFTMFPNDSLKTLTYPKESDISFYKFFPEKQWILSISKSQKDSFYILNTNGKQLFAISYSNQAPSLDTREFNQHIPLDRYGNIWENNPKKQTVRIINLEQQKFKAINQPSSNKENQKGEISNRGILVSSQGDLFITGRHTSQNDTLLSFNNHEIRGLALLESKDKQGLWITSSHKTGLFYYDYSTKEKLRYTYKNTKLKKTNGGHWAIHCDKKDQIWVGQKGLIQLDRKKKLLFPYQKYNQYETLKEAIIFDFHENQKGIWIASNKGLFLLSPSQGIIAHFHTQGKEQHKIPHDVITHIHEDKEGLFWLATKGGGIIRWNPQNKESLQLTKQEGLSHNITYAIYEDDYNNLWVSSNHGIMCLDKNAYTIRTYLKEDGMTDDEFNTGSHYQAKNGQLYFGGLNGITSFHPKDFQNKNSSSYPLQITEFLKRDSNTGEYKNHLIELIQNQIITIEPHEQSFTIRFALLDLHASKKHKYAYKIDEIDKKWIYTQTPSIHINKLNHGEYTLRIKAQGLGGKWSNELVFPIVSTHFFFLRPWFLILVAVLVIIAIFAGFRWRTKQYLKRANELEDIVQQRTQKIEEDKAVIEAQADELKVLDKLKSRFFTNISHELRTPLTLILGPASYLLNNPNKFNKQTAIKTLKDISKNGNNLLQLIEEILDLSKLDAHKLELFEEEIHLQTFLRRIVLAFEPQAVYQEIDFQFQFQAKDNLCVLLDLKKVEKVVNNLISNAIKYTPPKGRIEILVSENASNILLEVKDNGQGIHPDDLPHIFERFFQTKQTSKIEQGGTGVGLALSIELAQFMQGSLKVDSVYNQGSVFTFDIPKKEVDLNSDILAASNTPLVETLVFEETSLIIPQQSQKEFKVLIVEDNDDMRRFVEQLLSDVYTVASVGNGKKAIDYLEEYSGKIDLIVSDVMMPIMDGFELLNQVKKHPIWRKIPVILLTARADQMDKLQALTTGVDDYLTKPFSNEELLVRAKNLLYNYHQRKLWQIEQQQENKEDLSIDQFQDSKAIEQPKISEEDQNWIKEVAACVQANFSNNSFNATQLYLDMHMAEMTFRRRLRKITGLTGNKYLKEFRLQEARKLLEQKKYNTIQQFCYAVGFSDPQYFSKLYKNRFGKTPRDYFD